MSSARQGEGARVEWRDFGTSRRRVSLQGGLPRRHIRPAVRLFDSDGQLFCPFEELLEAPHRQCVVGLRDGGDGGGAGEAELRNGKQRRVGLRKALWGQSLILYKRARLVLTRSTSVKYHGATAVVHSLPAAKRARTTECAASKASRYSALSRYL